MKMDLSHTEPSNKVFKGVEHGPADRLSPTYTFPRRYERTLAKVAEQAGRIHDEKIVIHFVGVGEEISGGKRKASPQLLEAIQEFGKAGKRLEVHVFDLQKDLLEKAAAEARLAFPGVDILTHHGELSRFDESSVAPAHFVICTHVLQHNKGLHKDVLLYKLSKLLRPAGRVVLDHIGLSGIRLGLESFGLEERERVAEWNDQYDPRHDMRGFGVIIAKTAEPLSINEFTKLLSTIERKG